MLIWSIRSCCKRIESTLLPLCRLWFFYPNRKIQPQNSRNIKCIWAWNLHTMIVTLWVIKAPNQFHEKNADSGTPFDSHILAAHLNVKIPHQIGQIIAWSLHNITIMTCKTLTSDQLINCTTLKHDIPQLISHQLWTLSIDFPLDLASTRILNLHPYALIPQGEKSLI